MKVKFYFSLFLVVLLLPNINALRCVDPINVKAFATSNLVKVKEDIRHLKTSEGYEYCSIMYGIQQSDQTLTIDFGKNVENSSADINRAVTITFTIDLTMNGSLINPPYQQTLLYFMCDHQDACERHFWFDHIDRLIEEDNSAVGVLIRSVLIPTNVTKGKRICFTKHRTISC